MAKNFDKILGDILVHKKFLTPATLDKYRADIEKSGENLHDYITRHHYISEKQMVEALAAAYQIPAFDPRDVQIERSVLEKVPVRFALHYSIMPLKIEGKKLVLASLHPLDIKVQDDIRVHLGLEPQVVLATQNEILTMQNKYYGLAADTVERLTRSVAQTPGMDLEHEQTVEDLEQTTEDASIARLVNQILLEAYKKRATDIHIEPYRNKFRVRYRIDGVLVDANIPPEAKRFLLSIISRIKIIAHLSIVEKRIPQDGSAVVKTKEQTLDLRVSTIPTPHGESMVIRILPTNVTLLSLERLGFDPLNLRIFRELIKKPHGIILVTGPTGSGKTTTLYACLHEINNSTRKIITLEDPVEYELEGITQIQVNPKVNLSFAAGLRSVLRHDPDIIMVGEIRDIETAEIAIRTALTGHLVFSTLHTNDAASGITRLTEMGVEPFLVTSSLEAFVAQRLVRMICPKCRAEVKIPLLDIREEMGQALDMDPREAKIYRGVGCDYCNHTGFYGRTAIYEILTMSENIRDAILSRQNAEQIKIIAMREGMRTLRQDGWRKVLDGVTTPEEVLNITVKDVYSEDKKDKEPNHEHPMDDVIIENEQSQPVRIISKDILTAAEPKHDSRVYPRIPVKAEIRFSIVKEDKDARNKFLVDGVQHSSVTKDLSAGGLRFVCGYPLECNTILDLHIHLKNEGAPVNCLARICRVENDTLTSMFNLAAYFLDISSQDRARIQNFVNERLGHQERS